MIKQLSLSILALSLATPVSVQASSLNSASNLDVYFNQGEKAFDNGNWSKCEDTFRQWLLLKKDQPQQRVDTAVDYYADCTAFNAGDEFERGLKLWNQMPKKIVGGEVRYKESHWKKSISLL